MFVRVTPLQVEKYLYACYRCLPFCLATPPGFHVTRIPKGNLVSLLHKKEEKIAKKFKIVLAEKPNLQEAAEKSTNNWQNEQEQK